MSPATIGPHALEAIDPLTMQSEADAARVAALAFVEANKVAVVDVDTLARAVDIRTAIGEQLKANIAKLAKPKAWAYNLHQWFCGLERAALAPFEQLDVYERDQIRAFNDAQTQRRQARERELAEVRRREDEARATAEAALLERAGDHQMAAAVIAEAIAAPAPVVVLRDEIRAAVPQLQTRRRYLWRYAGGPENVKLTPPAVLAKTRAVLPAGYLIVDEKKLDAFAKAMKGSATVPGIEFYHRDDPVR